MKGTVPPPTADVGVSTPGLGSGAMVMNPKSARHAVTGLAFVIKILA